MDDEDRWFGVFQGYRPNGDGVEEVFAGLPDATEYATRIRSVCRAAHHDGWERDAYFVVGRPQPATDVELVAFGQEILSGLRLVAILATLSGRRDLHEYLSRVNHVAVVPAAACDRKNDDHTRVHEALGDILTGFHDYEHPAVRLREGFYSVACDYWLAWFLQWPYFHGWIPRDVFRPFFELWARGCLVAFHGGTLTIARQG